MHRRRAVAEVRGTDLDGGTSRTQMRIFAMSCMFQETCAQTPARCSRSAVLVGVIRCEPLCEQRVEFLAVTAGEIRRWRNAGPRAPQVDPTREPTLAIRHRFGRRASTSDRVLEWHTRHAVPSTGVRYRVARGQAQAGLDERITNHCGGDFARRQIDMLGLTRAPALMQGGHRRQRGMHARGMIHDMSHFHWRTIGVAASSSRARPTHRTTGRIRRSASPDRSDRRTTATAR